MNYATALELTNKLLQYSENPRLEAQLLLAHYLQCSRTVVFAYSERELSTDQLESYLQLVRRRVRGEPMAYLLGGREFWSLNLRVTKDTLIPRPETELLVERVLEVLPQQGQRVADLGTGTGAIALALARERPGWELFACDESSAALEVAMDNAQGLGIHNVGFYRGDWCFALPKGKYDAIVSNPPYLDTQDSHLEQGDLRFEPRGALVADENGFAALKQIARQARDYLNSGGWLFLEHGYEQKLEMIHYLTTLGYGHVRDDPDFAGNDRVICGQFV